MDTLAVLIAGAWGAITVFVAVLALHYRNRLMQALGAIKAWEQIAERPNIAFFKEEQVESLAQVLIPRLQAGLKGGPFVN